MTPQSEPNSLPGPYVNWEEWRDGYAWIVGVFKKSENTFSDRVLLEIRLKRLGFAGLNLFREMQHVVGSTA